MWGIGQREVVWSSITKTTLEIGAMVSALRCGLDATVSDYGPSASACSTVLNAKPTKQKIGDVLEEVLPFDLGRAHRLYKELLAPLERLISGKQLLIVPSGPLATLPLQVMLTESLRRRYPRACWSIAKRRGWAAGSP